MIDERQLAHPSDADIAVWAADATPDPAIAAHVAGCPECQDRLRQWTAVVEPIGRALRAEADAGVSNAGLARQAAHIMRRLRGEPPARVLPFPVPAAPSGADRLRLSGTVQRWVAAAALTGVVVGGGVARFFDVHPSTALTPPAAMTSVERMAPTAARRTAEFTMETAVTDEAFLVELDAALVSRAPEPLRVLDALTPERDPAHRPR
jgi:hypothetical protein